MCLWGQPESHRRLTMATPAATPGRRLRHGQPEGELLISLWENPAENVMEAGLIFPGLGREQQWFEENRARLTELGIL